MGSIFQDSGVFFPNQGCGPWEEKFIWFEPQEEICWNGLSMVNQGPHFTNNKSLAVIYWKDPHMLCIPGKAQTGLLVSRTILGWLTLAESTREALVLSFNQWTEKCLIQSELHNCIYICIYTDQSKLHDSNRLGLPEFENLICIKLDQLGTWRGVGGNFLFKSDLPSVSEEHFALPREAEAMFPRFANCFTWRSLSFSAFLWEFLLTRERLLNLKYKASGFSVSFISG